MPHVFDNIETSFLENSDKNGLKDALKVAHRGDFCVGYFNLRGWRSIDAVVESWPMVTEPEAPAPCRLLVGMQRVPDLHLITSWLENSPERPPDQKTMRSLCKAAAQEFRKQLTLGFPTNADEKGLRRLVKQLREGRLQVKLFLRHSLHAKLYLAHRDDHFTPLLAFLGSSNLTFSGLKNQGELNIDVPDQDAAKKLNQWFLDRWEDTRCLDISQELIEVIEESWAGEELVSPYHLYLKMAWHLSQDARDGIKEFGIPHDIREKLLPFQEKAVQIACRHLNKRGGVLVGDVVGLGKTRIASAIARVMADDLSLETLILCPKNLIPMWEEYVHEFGLRAPKVLSQSQAQKKLPTLPRYRLVIIDESHNFRNKEGRIYQALRDYIAHNDCKVILLSATPYNKTYLDLGAQLRLFLNEQSDIGIRPETLLQEIGEAKFSLSHPNTPTSSLAAFEHSPYADDWRDVMRLYMVRRTRSFIVHNYAEYDSTLERSFLTLPQGERLYFPVRQPKSVKYRANPDDPQDRCARLMRDEVVSIINELRLPRYGRSRYTKDVLPSDLSATDEKIIDDLTRAGHRMRGFCRTNLFKRLESSANAFLLSLHRHILRNELEIYALENSLPLPIGQLDAALLDTRLFDADDVETDGEGEGELNLEEETQSSLPPLGSWTEADYQAEAKRLYQTLSGSAHRKRYKWLRTDVFKRSFKQELRRDATALRDLLTATGEIAPSDDFKLQALIQLLQSTESKEKFLIFTQFADTGDYLLRALQAAGLEHVDCVTGDSVDPARQAWRFSPESNGKLDQFPPAEQTRILIATDVLSEGQNLQDAGRVINYDLPWAIIRLIQRAGRIDRIGQRRDTVFCYSFLPAEGVENVINLRQRIIHRLRENEEVVGSDEAFFEDQQPVDIESLQNLYDEKSGILDEPDDDEVDLTSEAYEVWSQETKDDPALRKKVEQLANVVYATKKHILDLDHPELSPPGVLTYIRTPRGGDSLLWLDADGKIVTESLVRIFRRAKCGPEETPLPRREDHHELVEMAVKIIQNERRGDTKAGRLGPPRGARYRSYERLNQFMLQRKDDLFLSDQILAAIQAIYDHPLTTEAVDKLNRQLRAKISDDDLADLVTTLHRDDRLVVANLHEEPLTNPQILCSIGLA